MQKFRIGGPTAVAAGNTATQGGGIGDCVDDTFVLSGSGKGSPVICGSFSGQHGDNFKNMLVLEKPLINLKSEKKRFDKYAAFHLMKYWLQSKKWENDFQMKCL